MWRATAESDGQEAHVRPPRAGPGAFQAKGVDLRSRVDDRADGGFVTKGGLFPPAIGATVFSCVAPGTVAGLVPYLISGWKQDSDVPPPVRILGEPRRTSTRGLDGGLGVHNQTGAALD